MQPRRQDFSVAMLSWRHFIGYGNLVNSLAGYEELAGRFESIKSDRDDWDDQENWDD